MPPLTVLSNSDVHSLLHDLRKLDIHTFLDDLGEALHSYSTTGSTAGAENDNEEENEISGCSSMFQPERTVMKRAGVTSLFMPASTGEILGVKVVSISTVKEPDKEKSGKSPRASLSSSVDGLKLTSTSTTSSIESGNTTSSGVSKTSSSSPSASREKTPSVQSRATDSSSVSTSKSNTDKDNTAPKGVITLMDRTGSPIAVLNALELTAFRTALASMFVFLKRHSVHTVTVFGAGRQAYWHIRLALILRGPEIHHVNIINRTFTRSAQLMRSFVESASNSSSTSSSIASTWRHVKFSALSPDFNEYPRLLKSHVRSADVIFCTTPSTTPLFPPEHLTSHEARRKGRYIAAIGSYTPYMIELHPDIIRMQTGRAEHHSHSHSHSHSHTHLLHPHHKHAATSSVIIVDTLTACLHEAGEIIQSATPSTHLVEIGELLMLKKANAGIRAAGGELDREDEGLLQWLQKGNVVYKSVGLGVMDVVVAGGVVRVAEERNRGVKVEDF